MLNTLLFYLISFAAVAFALGVVTARSAVYGVLCLVGSLCMIAGLFVLLKAYLVATVLVLVYAGAMLPKAFGPLESIFKSIQAAPGVFGEIEFHFIGTGKTAGS